ncbi:hypothetical protein RFI_38376, partial [Reticulomyxa filosa]
DATDNDLKAFIPAQAENMYWLCGRILSEMQNYQESEKYLCKAIEMRPDDPGYIVDYMLLLVQSERYDEALVQYVKARSLMSEGDRDIVHSKASSGRQNKRSHHSHDNDNDNDERHSSDYNDNPKGNDDEEDEKEEYVNGNDDNSDDDDEKEEETIEHSSSNSVMKEEENDDDDNEDDDEERMY